MHKPTCSLSARRTRWRSKLWTAALIRVKLYEFLDEGVPRTGLRARVLGEEILEGLLLKMLGVVCAEVLTRRGD